MRGQFDCVAINWKKTPFEPTKARVAQTLTVVSEKEKINNCIANSQSFLLEIMKDEYERQRKFSY